MWIKKKKDRLKKIKGKPPINKQIEIAKHLSNKGNRKT